MYSLLKRAAKHFLFLNWLTPLLIVLSPFLVSLATAFPFALKVPTTSGQSPLQLIEFVVPISTRVSTGSLLASALLLFLCTIPLVRAKVERRLVIGMTTLFSTLLITVLWLKLPIVNGMSIMSSYAYSGARAQVYGAQSWVSFISAGGTLLVLLNLITVVGQEQTA